MDPVKLGPSDEEAVLKAFADWFALRCAALRPAVPQAVQTDARPARAAAAMPPPPPPCRAAARRSQDSSISRRTNPFSLSNEHDMERRGQLAHSSTAARNSLPTAAASGLYFSFFFIAREEGTAPRAAPLPLVPLREKK